MTVLDRTVKTTMRPLGRAAWGVGLLASLLLAGCEASQAAGKVDAVPVPRPAVDRVAATATPGATLGDSRATSPPAAGIQSENTAPATRTPTPTPAPDVRRATSTPVPGAPLAPDFRLPDLEGNTWTLSQFRGQPVLLFFWATW
jgi:hypothetical protein